MPVIVVVHLPRDKESVLSEIFSPKCKLPVVEVQDKEPIMNGTIYIAPPDYHVLIEKNRFFSLSSEEPVIFSRPSIDVLFETAADAYGSALMGIVLSGASPDGAAGLKEIADAGGLAIVQDPATAAASVMPEAALLSCPTAQIMDLRRLSDYLKSFSETRVCA